MSVDVKKTILLFSIILIFATAFASKSSDLSNHGDYWDQDPFYIGVGAGYGNTNWEELASDNEATWTSTPISAKDNGLSWSAFAGYEFNRYFALQGSYSHFTKTTVHFSDWNDYGEGDSFVYLKTLTYTYSLQGRFMVPIMHTRFRAFADAGAAVIHREDVLHEGNHIGPTFGVGVNYVPIRHLMLELGFQYYSGYGKSTLDPAYNFVPFIYSVLLKVAYRF